MEKYFQPTWMRTVTRLNALKSNDDEEDYTACNLIKVLGEKRHLYYPACNSSELDCISGSSKSTPGPGGLPTWEPVSMSTDFPPTNEDSSPLVKASCGLSSDVEASSCTEVTESNRILKILHQVTFSSIYGDPYVYQGYETVGRRNLYAPPSDISGFVDEGFPLCTQIHRDKWEQDVSLGVASSIN